MKPKQRLVEGNCIFGAIGCGKVTIVEEFRGLDGQGKEIWEPLEGQEKGGELQTGAFGKKFPVCDNCLRTLTKGPKHIWGLGF